MFYTLKCFLKCIGRRVWCAKLRKKKVLSSRLSRKSLFYSVTKYRHIRNTICEWKWQNVHRNQCDESLNKWKCKDVPQFGEHILNVCPWNPACLVRFNIHVGLLQIKSLLYKANHTADTIIGTYYNILFSLYILNYSPHENIFQRKFVYLNEVSIWRLFFILFSDELLLRKSINFDLSYMYLAVLY